jgi:transcriptional regulator NrdR family protein
MGCTDFKLVGAIGNSNAGAGRTTTSTEKMLDSMTLALRKRPVSTEQVDSAAIERIDEKMLSPDCAK